VTVAIVLLNWFASQCLVFSLTQSSLQEFSVFFCSGDALKPVPQADTAATHSPVVFIASWYVDVSAVDLSQLRFEWISVNSEWLLLHPFSGLFSGTAWVSRYQEDKTSVDLNEARDDGVFGCSGISWTICSQSALRSRQITTLTSHHSNFYKPGDLPDAQQTASKLC